MSFYYIGGAIIAKEHRTNANRDMERQGYGPDNFSIPLKEEGGDDTIVNYGCYMPADQGLYFTLNTIVDKYDGEWVLKSELVDPEEINDLAVKFVRRLDQLLHLRNSNLTRQ